LARMRVSSARPQPPSTTSSYEDHRVRADVLAGVVDFGPFFLKFCSYFPYNARLCINGHEWAKRQAARERTGHAALDNGFATCDDPAALKAICDRLGPAHIQKLLDKWLAILPSPFTDAGQIKLPGAAVVKAFNTTFAAHYASPTEGGAPLDVYLAGDDAAARQTVGEFAASLGFWVINAGGMRLARALEEMAFLNISLNAVNGWPFQSAWKLVGPTGSA
jgi:hypothetical protein